MIQTISSWLPPAGSAGHYILQGALLFLLAALVARVLTWVIRHTLLSPRRKTHKNFSERRRKTLSYLISSIMNGLAVLATVIGILSLFIAPDALFTTLGLFSAALGFGARPYVSDFLGGIVLLFEDQFALGDKVEIGDREVMGVVERVSLRMTYIRGDSGELWLVPNGDVRTIRNFSRGTFSPANIKITVPTVKLDETLTLLLDVITNPGPDILEEPEIISADGEIGAVTTTLTLKVKAAYGKGPLVRRRLLARLQADLTEHHVIAD